MGIIKTFGQDVADAMCQPINSVTNEIGQDILDTLKLSIPQRALSLMKTAKQIRRERFIRVCCECKRWFDGEEWRIGDYPQGNQTHGYCEECCEKIMEEIREWTRT